MKSILPLLIPLTLLFPPSSRAAGPAAADGPATPGALVVAQPDGEMVAMPLEHTNVSIEVSAFVARTTVEQRFRNPFEKPVEAVYTFPLGDRAAVDDFEMVVGERVVRGEIHRREEARAVYEQARAEGYQAALLEQERPNVFTQSVANLMPGEAILVRLKTVETLPYERGFYRLRFPLVVGPRYVPGGGRVADASAITPPALPPGTRSGHDVSISVSLDAGVPVGTVSSPSHRISIERPDAARARIVLEPSDSIPNKDFLLRWSVASADPAVGVLTHRDGIDGFFTLLVQPKGEIAVAEAAPKEITFVVDTSGSMEGVPLEASKRFIAKALHELGPRDTFNLIRFAGDNTIWSRAPRPNTRADVEAALAWLEKLGGAGGTEMFSAMRAAFARPKDPDRLRLVVFATDGYVGNEAEILAAIGEVLGEARIYTVGIGSSVNHYLLDRMADLGHGAYVFVRPDETADDALEAFRGWVTRPYLTDLSIDWGALPVADTMPAKPRDLFSGQTLTLVGRYVGSGTGDVVVRGRLGGVAWERRVHVVLPEKEASHDALGSLWARWRVESLLLENTNDVPDSVRAEVIALALEHRLMTAYTSFVAVDTARVANPGGEQARVHQALPMPENVSFEGIFGKDGPPSLAAKPGSGRAEDAIEAGELERFRADKKEAAKLGSVGYARGGVPGGVVGGVVGGIEGGVASNAAPPPPLPPPPPSPRLARARSVIRTAAAESVAPASAAADRPVPGRFYTNVLTLAPGVQAAGGDGNSSLEEVEAFRPQFEAAARLRDAALRVLADIADDGALSPSGGRPALAALLAAQRADGAIADDVAVQALATWALAEAAAHVKGEPWLAPSAKKAATRLESLRLANGWPARPKGTVDAEATRWARLALAVAKPGSARPAGPEGKVSEPWRKLAAALSAPPDPSAKVTGGDPFTRLCANVRLGHLLATAGALR